MGDIADDHYAEIMEATTPFEGTSRGGGDWYSTDNWRSNCQRCGAFVVRHAGAHPMVCNPDQSLHQCDSYE